MDGLENRAIISRVNLVLTAASRTSDPGNLFRFLRLFVIYGSLP